MISTSWPRPSPRPKLILLCTPNNPTGVPISHEGLEAFLQYVRSDILVVIDEAYVEYAEAGSGPDSLALYRQYPNVCILRTFSKAYGLAGLRVGYAVAAPAIAEGLRRTALPFAVSALAQKAAIASLDSGEEMEARVAAVKQERARMGAQLEAQGWRYRRARAISCGSGPTTSSGPGWWTRSGSSPADARLPVAHGFWPAHPRSDLHGGLHRRGFPHPAPKHLRTRGAFGCGEHRAQVLDIWCHKWPHMYVASIDKIEKQARNSPENVSYSDRPKLCTHYVGEPRSGSGSHNAMFKMPWAGDPRINLQNRNGRAKPYQVKQAMAASDRSVEK